MREKLAIANQLRVSRKKFSNKPEYKQICSKCYYAYIVECILKGKNDFSISYGSKYVKTISERILDWCKYFIDIILAFFLINFTPRDYMPQLKRVLICFDVSKPMHIKFAEIPDEFFLHKFLEENGFKIVDEHLYRDSTVYDVTRA